MYSEDGKEGKGGAVLCIWLGGWVMEIERYREGALSDGSGTEGWGLGDWA